MAPMLLRACALLLPLAMAAACGGDPQADGTADAPPADAPTADEPPEPTEAAAIEANLTTGCVERFEAGVDYFPDRLEFDEATGVTVTYDDAHKVVDVDLPGGDQPLRYVLLQCGAPAPQLEGELADATVIEVPVSSLVTLTTTNLPHLDELGAVDRLVGVGTGAFVSTPSVVERIEAGEAPDFADASGQPDLERLVGADPDLLIMDGFGDEVLDDVARFSEAGVPTAVNADFDETTLLGRAEWIKFTALFLNAEAAAEAAFNDIATSYREIVERAEAQPERPQVIVNAPYQGTWFTPGGDSFLASAIADAGGAYVFADDDSTGSLSLDIETVLAQGQDADVWLQAGSVEGSLDDLLAEDPRFAEFAAFQDGQVWAQDRLTTEQGGNAVYELAYTRADLFLADLFAILHPEEGGDHELVFFGRVPEGDAGR